MNPGPLQTLLDTLPQKGRIEWIGIRPARSAPMVSLQQVSINQGDGLAGDRFSGRADSPRQVTLIQRLCKNYCARDVFTQPLQQEHLAVIAACVG